MRPLKSLQEISKEEWDSLLPSDSPFLTYEYLKALEESRSLDPGSGWSPLYFHSPQEAILATFMKQHSYGEYIFDWDWARAYQRAHLPYYPKLTSMVPFTPVTSAHFLAPGRDTQASLKLLAHHDDFLQENNLSSAHFLFLPPEEIEIFSSQNYLIRESMQYHFFNEDYSNFEDFLHSLKGRKAKQIRAERRFPHLKIERLSGKEIAPQYAEEMYGFYLSTIDEKQGIDYLRPAFFQQVFKEMSDQLLYIRATRDSVALAGALFFYDSKKLYGRYWGAKEYIPNLHFELCYYQGIEFCLQRKLKVFEAGAQGEHKITRGFRPIRTYSAHKIKHPAFREAISHYISEEKSYLGGLIRELSRELPFKSSQC